MPREIGPWALNKLRLLHLYLPGYLQAASRAIDRIYIDGFAGPGLNELRATGEIVDGSPLEALAAKAPDNDSRFTRLHFIERDPRVAAELRETFESSQSRSACGGHRRRRQHRAAQNRRAISSQCTHFRVLDTDAIEPAWSTIAAIASHRTELLLNFPHGFALNRNARSPKVSTYFGTDAWLDAWGESSTGRTRRLLDLYKARLTDLGYTEQVENDRLISSESGGAGRRFYYLIPASKHPAAKTIWDWVFKQPEARGQSRLDI